MDYLDTFNDASDHFDSMTVLAGARLQRNLVDMSARSGYSLIGAKPKTARQSVCEYYNLDWETGEHIGGVCTPDAEVLSLRTALSQRRALRNLLGWQLRGYARSTQCSWVCQLTIVC